MSKPINQRKRRIQKKTEQQPNIKKETAPTSKNTSNLIRLNKFIANAGVCSRREADKLISEGLITVNGKVVAEIGKKVTLDDTVTYKGKDLNPEKMVYVLLNKPKGFVTTVKDPHADKTVMDLVTKACAERIYPVGRLDKMTTGLLLFTNDGDLAKTLTHPKHEHRKIYHAFLDTDVAQEHLDEIARGIELEDGLIKSDSISYVGNSKKEVGIEIHSGKNRIVRRIFDHFGYQMEKLDRVYFAGLTKLDLPRGRWRYLTEREIGLLKGGLLK